MFFPEFLETKNELFIFFLKKGESLDGNVSITRSSTTLDQCEIYVRIKKELHTWKNKLSRHNTTIEISPTQCEHINTD